MAAIKTASVNARIDQNVKNQAEAILSRIGLPRSVAIDLYYRQIIMHGGIPFALTVSEPTLPVREKMTKTQFDRMMAEGLEQAKADDSYDFDEAFDDLESGLGR